MTSDSNNSLGFKYACFISYRNGDRQRENSYIFRLTRQLKEDLKDELEFLLEPGMRDVFLDTDHLRGGDLLNNKIFEALCQSVCMICLWTPIYFSKSHPYCAKEYRTMEIIEQKRLQLLGISNSTSGLIIPLTLRFSRRFPSSINRLYINFDRYLLQGKEGLKREDPYFEKIREIARYIAERYWELRELSQEQLNPCYASCLESSDEEEFQQWLNNIVS